MKMADKYLHVGLYGRFYAHEVIIIQIVTLCWARL